MRKTGKSRMKILPKEKADFDVMPESASILHLKNVKLLVVNWLGLEPRTHTLKVYCSTN